MRPRIPRKTDSHPTPHHHLADWVAVYNSTVRNVLTALRLDVKEELSFEINLQRGGFRWWFLQGLHAESPVILGY
jgi:hypothetical protein